MIELIEKTSSKQRIYQLDFKIYRYANGTIKDFFKNNLRLKPEYELDDYSEYIDKVCISDANSHIERLCFPAFFVKNKLTGEQTVTFITIPIAGYFTFKIHGGDPKLVYPDMVYIRYLRRLNGGVR